MTEQTFDNKKESAIKSMSFEAAMTELEQLVRKLESGEAPLDEAISNYERGIALKNHCETKLKEAQAKIEKITVRADGALSTEPFDPENA